MYSLAAAPPTVEHMWVLDAARREVAAQQQLDALIAAAAGNLPKFLQPLAAEESAGLTQLDWQLSFVSKDDFGESSMQELLLLPSTLCILYSLALLLAPA